MKEKKARKGLTGILIGIGIVAAILWVGVFVFIIYFFTGGPVQITKDARLYEETMYKYTSEVVGTVHTGFFAFPVTIPRSAFADGKKPTFYFSYRDTWDDPTCEVYLKCAYSDADYADEIDRLANSVFELGDDGKKVTNQLEYENSGRFLCPVYKAIDCDSYSYEYAMDLGNNEIAYIYTSFIHLPITLKAIPKKYLPDDFTKSIMRDTYGDGSFNVYVVERTAEYTLLDYGDRFKFADIVVNE